MKQRGQHGAKDREVDEEEEQRSGEDAEDEMVLLGPEARELERLGEAGAQGASGARGHDGDVVIEGLDPAEGDGDEDGHGVDDGEGAGEDDLQQRGVGPAAQRPRLGVLALEQGDEAAREDSLAGLHPEVEDGEEQRLARQVARGVGALGHVEREVDEGQAARQRAEVVEGPERQRRAAQQRHGLVEHVHGARALAGARRSEGARRWSHHQPPFA